jgi:hypothetical protein
VLKELIKYYRKSKEFILLIRFLNLKAKKILRFDDKKVKIDLVSIAFNNPFLIEYQILLLKKNLQDSYFQIIADNSTNADAKVQIKNICSKYKIFYVELPQNSFKRNKSHGAAMHWVYKNILRKRKTEYFGFLDHDIFPTKPTSIIERMQKGIYSRLMHAYKNDGYMYSVNHPYPYWSLWAGFYFIKSSLLSSSNIYSFNFFPYVISEDLYLDTGGGLWKPLYSKMIYPGEMADFKQYKFRETDNGNIQTDFYEMFDDWIHFVNISNWYVTPSIDEKKSFVISKLEALINS